MADLNLKNGDKVLVEMTVERPTPDKDGDIYGRVEGYAMWLPPDKIHSKVYPPIEEPQTIGSVVRTPSGKQYTRFTNQGDTPWVSDSGSFWMWREIEPFEPELVM